MLLYSNATTSRDDAGFVLDVDARLVCNFRHVSRLTARTREGVIDSIEYYLEDERQQRRTWGPFCFINYDTGQDLAGPGVYFFLVNAKIAYFGHCSNFTTRLQQYAEICKSDSNQPQHQPICRINTMMYRAFQRRDMVHCFFYPLEDCHLVHAMLVDIVKPAWNLPQ
ncbi:GIY-YIG nuclease family protein [Megalodesulfovibrio paquesii]